MSASYNLQWLQNATFKQLDAAMNDPQVRPLLEPTLRTAQGDAAARRIIAMRSQETEQEEMVAQGIGSYDIEWLEGLAEKETGLTELKAALVVPAAKAQLENVMRTKRGAEAAMKIANKNRVAPSSQGEQIPPTPEEQALIDADMARAEAEAAEAANQPTTTEPVVPPTKIVVDYQVTDEKTGQPIGRPTHFESFDVNEIIEKLKNAHINAVRYAERLKKGGVKLVEDDTQQRKARFQAKQAQAEADAALAEATATSDPVKLREAVTKVSKADREQQIADEIAREAGARIGTAFMHDHAEDFLWCEASAQMLGKWLGSQEPKLEATYSNLELAYEATKLTLPKPNPAQLEDQLRQAGYLSNVEAPAPVEPPAPVAPIAPPAVATAVLETIATPTTVPPVAAPAPNPTPAKVVNPPAARRPGVNGGLQPGTLSAQRPGSQQQTSPTTDRAALLREIKNLNPTQYREKVRTSKEFRDRLAAAGIGDAASTVR